MSGTDDSAATGNPLFLSLWLGGFSPLALPIYFRKTLEVFPFSKLNPASFLRVWAVSFHEVPVFESFLDTAVDAREAADLVQEILHDDCCIQLETRWDLWLWDGDWALKPSRVCIELHAPLFEHDVLNPLGPPEQIWIDLGREDLYLPQPKSDQLRPVQSNIRSILHLADDLEEALTVERRLLWSESEDNFAERLMLLLDEPPGTSVS
jgi:hypothetical protein